MEQTQQELHLTVGGIGIRVVSQMPMTISEGVKNFLEASEKAVTITVKKLDRNFNLDHAVKYGQDLHFQYLRDNCFLYAVARPGVDGSVSTAVYTPDFSEANLYLNTKAFPDVRCTVDFVLQLFPLRHLLFCHQAVVLHSSRVNAGGKAIVFSAPSQTGKSTQAGFWERYAGAKIVSGDRSILRQEEDGFYTYGYPIDGSNPVYDNSRIPIGAVVMLSQGKENQVERLSVLQAINCLTSQTVVNPWDTNGSAVRQLWLDLVAQYPVYRLTCRPDKEAVSCLKDQLERDGVI